jgi:hypothetical protein
VWVIERDAVRNMLGPLTGRGAKLRTERDGKTRGDGTGEDERELSLADAEDYAHETGGDDEFEEQLLMSNAVERSIASSQIRGVFGGHLCCCISRSML